MEHKKVAKFLAIIGYLFMILSFFEIEFFILLNFTEFNDIKTNPILLSEFIYGSEYSSLDGTLLFLFVFVSMICFLILGFFILRTSKSEKIKDKSLAKLMVVIGMVIILGAFVKMNYIVLLGKTEITTIHGDIRFQSALYDFDITPILPAIMWLYFISVTLSFMISGLITTTLGIKWTLLVDQLEDVN
ncbi:MAG: hypothetical protein ACFFFT_07325 [Candidatus Thorarchaeota archaeon]